MPYAISCPAAGISTALIISISGLSIYYLSVYLSISQSIKKARSPWINTRRFLFLPPHTHTHTPEPRRANRTRTRGTELGGRDPRDALGRHPSADPRRWRPAGEHVAGAPLGITAVNSKLFHHRHFARPARSTAVGTTPGASGSG
jgi:hypothetical protein